MVLPGEPAFYHCVSKVRGQEMLITDDEKSRLRELMRRIAGFSGVEVKSFCLMDSHFHMVVKVPKWRDVGDAELIARMRILYGDAKTDAKLSSWKLWEQKGQAYKVVAAKAALRKRMYNLSDFFKTLKERYAKDFNRRSGSKGVFWSERFSSALLAPEKVVLTSVGVYGDLNPVREGIVRNPEKYKFSGLGEAARGDVSALEGIRDLIEPVPKKNKRVSLDEAFAEYKNIVTAKLPEMGTGTKLKVGKYEGTGTKLTYDYIKGAAIGSLKFVGKVALVALGSALTIQDYAYTAHKYKHYDEYYSARKIRRSK